MSDEKKTKSLVMNVVTDNTTQTQENTGLSREKLEVDRTVDEDAKRTVDEDVQQKKSEGKDEKKGKTKKEKDEVTKEEEKMLRELENYHGYVSREDLSSLLKIEGDFLVRMTEVEGTKTAKREIVLSLMINAGNTEEPTNQDYQTLPGVAAGNANLKARNMVIRRSGGKYRIEGTKTFLAIKEMIEYYKKNYGQVSKNRFILRNAVNQQTWEFSHDDVKFSGKVLGEGAYGMVKAGTLNMTKKKLPNVTPVVNVAVKMAKGTSELSKAKIKEMMREARLMRNLSHKNVVKLYGVAVLEQPLYIILELIQGGELKVYLKNHVGKVDTMEKLKMCQGAANGLDYLHKQGYIHRDIAARNCLYTVEKIVGFMKSEGKVAIQVKISDFGLSRHCSEYKIKTNMKLPIKWLSPETIEKYLFTSKSDVYSYGILMFEVFADGGEAWPGVANGEVKKKVLSGVFLEIPASCPQRLRTFCSEKIFQKDPVKRAEMSEIGQVIETLVANPDLVFEKSKNKAGKRKESKKEMKSKD